MDTLIRDRSTGMNDLTLICETCRFPINGDTGCIYVIFPDINTARRQEDSEIHWRTSHYAHFTGGVRDTYEIGAERISTWRQLIWWTAHLMEKSWFPLSDWDDLLRELTDGGQPQRIRIVAKEAA
jgi:hypothetical protein